jgi:hypothetical protein
LLVNLAARRGADDDATSIVVQVGGRTKRHPAAMSLQPVMKASQAAAALRAAVGLTSGLAAAAMLMVMLIYLLAPPAR